MTPALLPYVTIDSAAPYVSGNSARPKNGALFKRDVREQWKSKPHAVASSDIKQSNEDPHNLAPPQPRAKIISFAIPQSYGIEQMCSSSDRSEKLRLNTAPPSAPVQAPREVGIPDPPYEQAQDFGGPTEQEYFSSSISPGYLVICMGKPDFRHLRRGAWALLWTHDLKTDHNLFYALRLLRKRHYGWRRLFLTVKEIHYMKVKIDKNKATDMSYPSLPPDDRREYQYEPRPAIRKPPLPPRYLASAFHAMGIADRNDDDSSVVLRSLPRLTDTAKVDLLAGFRAEKEEVWGIAIVEGHSNLGMFLSQWGPLIVMPILFVLYIKPSANTVQSIIAIIALVMTLPLAGLAIGLLVKLAQKHKDEVYILRGVIQPQIALDYASLNPWLRFMVRSTRRCYSIWRWTLSSVIPWFAFETSNRIPESHTASGFVSVHQNASRSSGIPETASGGSGNERPNNTNADEDFVHGVGFSFRSLDNGEGGENNGNDNGNDNGNGGGNDDGDSNFNGGGDGNGNGNSDGTIYPQELDLEAGNLYLHIIMGAGKSDKKQVAIEVTGIDNDYDLFTQLRETYRKRRPWSYPMLMVKSISPAEYVLFNHINVYTFVHNDTAKTMPDIHNPPPEYNFSYLPREPVPVPPLLRPEQLLSLFDNPAKSIHMSRHGPAEYEKQCYMRSPKRRGALVFTNNNGYPTGFGFEIEEGLDKKFILACELLIIVVSVLTAVLYICLMKGDQKFGSAATIGGYIFVLLNFLYLCIIAATEKYRLWAY